MTIANVSLFVVIVLSTIGFSLFDFRNLPFKENLKISVTVSKNLSRDDIKNLISIRLNQDKAVKETDIDDVVITGQGSTVHTDPNKI